MANWAGVAAAVELIMGHAMAVEIGSPISYMGVKEEFIILCQGKVRELEGQCYDSFSSSFYLLDLTFFLLTYLER